MESSTSITQRERAALLIAVLIISICALVYELLIATLSSYLLGNSVAQFSYTIGIFLFSMGLGSLLSRQIKTNELRWFIIVELLIALFGGISATALYAIFTEAYAYYLTTMALVSLSIGICIGLEIPLLARVMAQHTSLGDTLANILSVDYIGALIASLAFPLILLPLLGVLQTAFVMGLSNVLVGGLLLWMFQARLARRWSRRLWIAAGAIGTLMIAGTILSTDVVRYFEQRLYADVILYRHQTPYQRIIITRDDTDVRLYLDGDLQFSSRDEYRYHEMLVHPAMSIARSHEQILILGGGDGLAARELLAYDGVQQITIVDLDPAMTDLARDYPLLRQINAGALDDPRVRVINADAFNFVNDDDGRYNVIIIDLPDPNSEGLGKLYSEQFYRLLRDRLTADGVFITQATSPYFVRESFWMIANTITAADYHTQPLRAYVPSFGEWGFVIGSDRRIPPLTMPDDSIPLRYLTAEVLESAQHFDPDTAWLPTDINTLDNPILPTTYENNWRQWN